MYNTILRLYQKTGNEAVVNNAVLKGWITEEDARTILGTE